MPANETKKKVPLNMDEIIKMMFKLSDRLTIGMINSLFRRNIPLDAKVIYEGWHKIELSKTIYHIC
jgi:hypothetical protein